MSKSFNPRSVKFTWLESAVPMAMARIGGYVGLPRLQAEAIAYAEKRGSVIQQSAEILGHPLTDDEVTRLCDKWKIPERTEEYKALSRLAVALGGVERTLDLYLMADWVRRNDRFPPAFCLTRAGKAELCRAARLSFAHFKHPLGDVA